MDQQNENIEFKGTREYLHHWDEFFEEWSKGESHQKKLLENDKIWSKHKGTEWETNEGKKRSTKLEPDAFPQPYLGNIDDHSVITLNLNPSRSKKYGYENFKEPVLDSSYKYNQYAESFPTYDTHPFWKKQDDWIDSIFKKILVEEILVEEKLYQYNPETKKKEKLKPFAIEICPWGSKKFQNLKIKKDDSLIEYMDHYVFDVIEKVIEHSKLKIVLSVGKAYYDIFNDSSTFIKLEEISSKLFDEEFTFLEDDYKTYNNCLEKSKEYEPEEKMTAIPYNWPMKFIKRTFSIWKRGEVLYLNSYASGSNTPPADHFDEIQNKLITKYLNKL